MLHLIRKITTILNRAEKRRLWTLMLMDIAISIADIVCLALLLFIVHVYTDNTHSGGRWAFLSLWLTGPYALLIVLVFFLFFSVKNLLGFLIYRAQCRFLYRVASRISRQKLVSYLEGNYSGYTDVDSSVHIREISYHPLDFCQHVLGGIQQIVTQTALIVLAITGILFFNARLFLLLFVILLPPLVAVFYLIKGRLRAARKHARASSEKSLQYLQEALSGYVESNIYHKNAVFLERFVVWQRQFNKYVTDQMIVQGLPGRMIEIFALMGIVILIAVSKYWGNAGGSAIITIGVFMAAAYKIIPGIVKILTLSGQINSYAFTADNLGTAEGALSVRNEGDPGSAIPVDAAKPIRSVRFSNVRFSYNGHPILHNQHLRIEPGDFLGIAGPSGKGKTTILNLLLGFLTPDEGEIHINGDVLDSRARQRYWSSISYVKQQSFLIHDSIRHNITLNGTDCDETKLQEAISAAGLEELVASFPEKDDKIIAENGKNISGGQRQRIAIARALYKSADLIILDEPFNELDEASEMALLFHFQQLTESGKMVILITHNKYSLSFCNKIVTLDESPV